MKMMESYDARRAGNGNGEMWEDSIDVQCSSTEK
jgi:hypothetical protein